MSRQLFKRIYLFDDCDTQFMGNWDDRDQTLQATLRFLFKLFCSKAGNGALIDPNDCILYAYLDQHEYILTENNAQIVLKENNADWLQTEDAFDMTMNSAITEARTNPTLFLIDWTMSKMQWGEADKRTGVQLLDRLYNQRDNLSGVITCYTSAIDDASFRSEYALQKSRFLSGSPYLRLMKLHWRWNDIEATECTLYRKLCMLMDEGSI